MKTSARNQIPGRVVRIKKGIIAAQVDVETKENEVLTALITIDSLESLGIKEGTNVFLLIKATWVIIALDGMKISARNVIPATVKEITRGPVDSEVVLETDKGTLLVSLITNESVENLKLELGKRVNAVFKASHVIVGV